MTSDRPQFLENALSVAGLTDYIQTTLQEDPQLRSLWVVGEVSSAKKHASGIFFTLADPGDNSSITCVVWKSQISRLTAFPTAGEQMLILGSLRLYRKQGRYQLSVWQILPVGEGFQALRYRRLRNRLATEGLFDAERKRSLPRHPHTIAVVTSPQAAAWGDIQRTLVSRYPGLRVLLSPTLVQGDRAPQSIVKAIDRVSRDGRAQVLILARGGGATEDLAAFDDERVVRAIATCAIPVITGIGHQRDESLADLAADWCAHTPTAAAERVVPELAVLCDEHRDRQFRLHRAVVAQLQQARSQVQQLRQRLSGVPVRRQLQQERQQLERLDRQLRQAVRYRLQQAQQHHQLLREKLAVLDPEAVLQRGYAVVRGSDGEILRSPAETKIGRVLTLQLAQGQVKVKVTKLDP
ncbi:exodeoxyribonuclease VII large subunit [Baaleninema sp.]|uniref:exodeoxyribonuclease VII large subunit n=1 Tax=Baaleninema sp. TaxID=3101197 RepID=UPI003CFC781C